MNKEERGLNKQWKKRLAEVGQKAFEFEEMKRLGFLSKEKISKLSMTSGIEIENYEKAKKTLSDISTQLNKIDSEIDSIDSIEVALSRIRTRRIKRVKEETSKRKIQKNVQLKKRAQEICQERINRPKFLGKDVSNRLDFSGGDIEKLKQKGLPVLVNFLELSSALNLKPQALQWMVYEREASKTDHYTRFEIPKKSGGKRLISSPKPALRNAQKWILESILSKLDIHSAATAFRPGKSILDNAKLHANSKVVLRLDLKDFFPSITFIRIRGLFESLGYNPGISTVFSLLCTDSPRIILKYHGETHYVKVGTRNLPQGACTSPSLANIIANKLDRRLQKYTEKTGWLYSRYADDLVFSSNAEEMPAYRLVKAVSKIVASEGFKINKHKTNIMRHPNRQIVTGLVVNNDVRISRNDLRKFRAFLHHCETKGLESVSKDIGKDAISVARGYLSYINMISPELGKTVSSKHLWISK